MPHNCPPPPTGLQPESALHLLLTGNAAVMAACPGGVYPNRMTRTPAQDADLRTKTTIVYQRIGGPVDYHLRGPVGLQMGRFWLDIYGNTHSAVRTARDAVQAVLSGYRGTPMPGVQIQAFFFEGLREFYDAEPEYRQYRSNTEFTVHYLET